MTHDETYSQLTDAEWEAVLAVIAHLFPPGKLGRGRKRAPMRNTMNAMLHGYTLGIPMRRVTSNTMDYPSAPTIVRFQEALIDSGALKRVVEALSNTRPRLIDQIRLYNPSHMASLQHKEDRKDNTWGVCLTALPWGPPGKVYNEQE
jgi:hypothetical protein